MPRRRPSFVTYARRRWRVVGLLLVLLAGSLLILAVTDRGHDPRWAARGEALEQAALSPDGSTVYALQKANGNVTGLEARRGADGHLLWQSAFNATRALVAAGDEGVAVATDFPLAYLTFYGQDGRVAYQVPLEGVPRALALEGGRVALALQAPGNPVLVLADGRLAHEHRFGSFVNAIDLRGGNLAVGTGAGELRVAVADTGAPLYNGSFGVAVRSLRLAHDGRSLFAGGSSLGAGDLSGSVAFVDLTAQEPLRWTRRTTSGVAYASLDASGVFALAVEEAPPRDVVHVYDASPGTERWTREIVGGLAQGDAGAGGGVSLAPDGSAVVVGTLHGGLAAYRVGDGARVWSYRAEGMTLVTHAAARPDVFVADGRLNSGAEDPGLFLFDASREPLGGNLVALGVVVTLLLAGAAAAALGIGFWRLRRSY